MNHKICLGGRFWIDTWPDYLSDWLIATLKNEPLTLYLKRLVLFFKPHITGVLGGYKAMIGSLARRAQTFSTRPSPRSLQKASAIGRRSLLGGVCGQQCLTYILPLGSNRLAASAAPNEIENVSLGSIGFPQVHVGTSKQLSEKLPTAFSPPYSLLLDTSRS